MKELRFLDELVQRYPVLEPVKGDILKAYEIMRDCYEKGGKLMIAGNGGSCSDSEHIVGELMKGFVKRRPVSAELAQALKAADPQMGEKLAENLQGGLPAIALDNAVRQGKALYVGISNYNRADTAEMLKIFRELRTPFIINQPSYSILNRWIEDDKLDSLAISEGFGIAVFSPLYQGFLTSKYLKGIPADSRVGRGETWIGNELNDKMIEKLNKLNDIAASRGQTLSQMALSWVLHNKAVTTVLIGASRPEQITENIGCLDRLDFTEAELAEIDRLAKM